MSSETLHEPAEKLSAATIDRHRAIVSLMEELEAVDWYDQRVDAATDPELREILRHNRDEEQEHAAMVLEWQATQEGRRRARERPGKMRRELPLSSPFVYPCSYRHVHTKGRRRSSVHSRSCDSCCRLRRQCTSGLC